MYFVNKALKMLTLDVTYHKQAYLYYIVTYSMSIDIRDNSSSKQQYILRRQNSNIYLLYESDCFEIKIHMKSMNQYEMIRK